MNCCQQGITDIEIRVRPWEQTVGFLRPLQTAVYPLIFLQLALSAQPLRGVFAARKRCYGTLPSCREFGSQFKFLNQAVVDIWAQKFLDALREVYPDIQYQLPEFEIQNLIDVPQAFEYKSKGFLRVFGYFSDLSLPI